MTDDFHQNPQLDHIMRVQRDGDPDQRRRIEQAITATTRVALGYYEQAIDKRVAAGLPIPAGVVRPPQPSGGTPLEDQDQVDRG